MAIKKVSNQVLSATEGDIGGVWTDWTPSFTNLTVSSSTVVAKYKQIGKTVHFMVSVVLAGGNKPSNSVSMSVPVTMSSVYNNTGYNIISQCSWQDTGTATYTGNVTILDTNTVYLRALNAGGTYLLHSGNVINATIPHTWANTDTMFISGIYEAA